MNTIKIKQINLRYFKGVKELSIDFNETTTNVFGDNATGKTTIFDAFTWLLFGKDSQGMSDSNFSIKTFDENGKIIPKVEHEVSAVLLVNGSELKLKRIFREKWERKRGDLTQTFTGNETACEFDETPISITEYNKRISELLNENLFRLITNPLYFNSLNWKDRRNVLINLSGEVTNEQITDLHPEFKQLIEGLNGKTIEDLKAKTAQQKKVISDELKLIPTRADEVRISIPEEYDFSAIENQITQKQTEVAKIDEQIADQSKAMQSVYDEINRKRAKINELKGKQSDILFKARDEERNRVQNANASILDKESSLKSAKAKLQYLDRELQIIENDLSTQTRVQQLEKQRDEKLKEWHAENDKGFTANAEQLICPLFKHKCADAAALKNFSENNEKAIADFNQNKIITLERITREGVSLKDQIEKANENLTAKSKNEISLKTEIEQQRKSIDELQKEFDHLKVEEIKPIDAETIPEWVKLNTEITAIEAEIKEPEKPDNSQLEERKRKLNFEIDELKTRLNAKSAIEKCKNRLSELDNEEKKLAQQVSEFEKTEFEILEFTKAKMEEVDRRVNGMFSFVKFKLFETQINGSEVECCETLINTNGSWVPYTTGGNTAGRVNAGIDIINALCQKNGVTAPIFIDNRESINTLIESNSQIINLIVSNDKKLTIK